METYKINGDKLSFDMLVNIIYDSNTIIKIDDEITKTLTNDIKVTQQNNTQFSEIEVRAILIVYIISLLNKKASIKLVNKYISLLNSNDISVVIDDQTILTCAKALILLKESKDVLKSSNLIIAASLDGYNGNTSPFIEDSYIFRPYASNKAVAYDIITQLEGSSVFVHDLNKAVQDPLSFRDAAHINGAWLDCMNYFEEQLLLQINSTNDFSCDNWILTVEELGNAIAHSSKFSCYRTLKFCNPEFTKLPRFLAFNDSVLGFATLQKVYCALDSEIRHLSNPISYDLDNYDFIYCIDKTYKIIDNFRYILGIELMHAAQAIDLRTDHHLGKGVKNIYSKYREFVEMYTVDRVISDDIEKSYQFILKNELLK